MARRDREELAERTVAAVIGVGRTVWGLVTVAAPGPVHRALGVEYPGPDRGVWIRAFGAVGPHILTRPETAENPPESVYLD